MTHYNSQDIVSTLKRMAQLEPGLKSIVNEFVQSWPYVDEHAPAHIALVGMQYSGIPQLANAVFASDRKRSDDDMTWQENAHEGQGYTLVQMPYLRDMSWNEGIAWRGLRSTDLVLYVHNAKHDTLRDEAQRFLRLLVSWTPYNHWRSRMVIPVLTNCDELDAQQMEALSARISLQWKEILGVEPMGVFGVCARHYMAAHEAKNNEAMVASMIPRLQEFLMLTSHPQQLMTLRQAKEHMMVQRIVQLATRRAAQTRDELDARMSMLKSESSRMRESYSSLQQNSWEV